MRRCRCPTCCGRPDADVDRGGGRHRARARPGDCPHRQQPEPSRALREYDVTGRTRTPVAKPMGGNRPTNVAALRRAFPFAGIRVHVPRIRRSTSPECAQDLNGRVAELYEREPAYLSVLVESAVNVLRHAGVLQPDTPSSAQQVHRKLASRGRLQPRTWSGGTTFPLVINGPTDHRPSLLATSTRIAVGRRGRLRRGAHYFEVPPYILVPDKECLAE